jgi:hypothetical protein
MSAGTRKRPVPPFGLAAPANVCIEITPSAEQYGQLSRDLATLRRAGADSNTAAVVSAVHAAAAAKLANG